MDGNLERYKLCLQCLHEKLRVDYIDSDRFEAIRNAMPLIEKRINDKDVWENVYDNLHRKPRNSLRG